MRVEVKVRAGVMVEVEDRDAILISLVAAKSIGRGRVG